MCFLTLEIKGNQRVELSGVKSIVLTPIEPVDSSDPEWMRRLVIRTEKGTFELELHADEEPEQLEAHLQSEVRV